MPKCKDAEYCPLQKPVKPGKIIVMHVKKTRHLTKGCSLKWVSLLYTLQLLILQHPKNSYNFILNNSIFIRFWRTLEFAQL